MDGILNINKSSGMTSFAVVAAVRRLCHERRVGHAGTLDPLAEGVLPVLVGRATRVAEYLLESDKAYRAQVEFGSETDTGDAEGQIIRRGDIMGLDQNRIVSVLDNFRGRIFQTPPMFSALKHKGRPLYRYAREGITIEREARSVEISGLELISWEPPVAGFDIVCSHGTYVRTLAEDIGKVLGCGAHLKNLVRVRYGPFDLAASVSLERLAEAIEHNDWHNLLNPIDSVLMQWPALIAGPETEVKIRCGQPVSLVEAGGTATHDGYCRAYSLDGCFLGVLRFKSDKDEWQPKKIFL